MSADRNKSVMFQPRRYLANGGVSNASTSNDPSYDDGLGNDNYAYSDDESSVSRSSFERTYDNTESEDDAGIQEEGRSLQSEEGLRQKMNWDVFQVNIPKDKKSRSLRFWNRVHVGVRVTLCLVLFLLVLASSSLSKLLFLVTAYNINFTNKGLPDDSSGEFRVDVAWVWSMIITVTAPYFFTALRNFLRLIFKRHRPLQIIPFVVVLVFETCHSIGLCLFVFLVAPSFNPVIVLMLGQGVGLIPSICKLSWSKKTEGELSLNTHEDFAKPVWRLISTLTCLLHASFIGVAAWRVYDQTSQPSMVAVLVVSLILISMRWWDNFIQRKKQKKWEMKQKKKNETSRFYRPESVTDLLKHIDRNRVRIDLFVSIWKIILTMVLPAVVLGGGGTECQNVFHLMSSVARTCGIIPGFTNVTLTYNVDDTCGDYLPYLVAVISVVSSGIGYKMAKAACKIRSQVWCFSLPLALVTPMSYILLLISYSQKVSVSAYIGCRLSWFHLQDGGDIFKKFLGDYTYQYYLPIVVAGFLTILFLCVHIWTPTADRVASTDKLFNRPLYCGIFFDTSLMMNRRSDDSINIRHDTRQKMDRLRELNNQFNMDNPVGNRDAKVPMVYVCVTMWHETEVEMLQLLKSVFTMDQDQSTRRHVLEMLGTKDKDFYTMEAHILFDNAFGDPKEDEDPYLVNMYVKKFVSTINQAASQVYISVDKLLDPTKIITPYGGQLIWAMPGGNQLIVHLKHKAKIRIKKRWSQVMYMYYLLSHKMICEEGMSTEKLKKISKNTFILTLDGDVDFQPTAVQMMLDRMKKSPNVGAACGRIHPIGTGPVIWYQKFEYAMSHWLQKAAEHVIGCVLCSPGCFSMFRASALMDDNVLRKYAEESKEPRQYIQYDQGEDRWLCTLLLQQGHRIEYCAAADAKTYAPEGFREFFNQRRRWTPSTMANILDVLQSSGRIRRNNNDISLLYIIFQGFLFLSSVLTPGTIFLLIFSAINTAYPALALHYAMLLNLAPVTVFIILLFTTKTEIQLAYAGILSILYALVMMIVLVGVFKQIVQSNFCSMTAGFFLYIVGVFILAALLHPQEFVNVIHGFLYFLAIPCMSMLLMFYAFGNLHVVSWGTRDSRAATVATDGASPQDEKKKKRSALHDMLRKLKGSDDSDSDYVFSFGNLFRCICCPRPVIRDHTSKMELILEKMEDIEYTLRQKDDNTDEHSDYGVVVGAPDDATPFSKSSMMFEGGELMRSNPLFHETKEKLGENDKDNIPRWTKDKILGTGPSSYVNPKEHDFWKELIEEYLTPLTPSDKEKEEVANGLTGLRNTVCTFFFLSNCLFVTLMFILESVSTYTPSLVFHLPCDPGVGGATREPVAIAFTLIFGILLFIQFVCMLIHRFSTLLAIASITEVHFTSETTQEKNRQAYVGLVEDLYMHVNNEYEGDNLSIASSASGTGVNESPGNTLTKRHSNALMKRFLRDASRKAPEKPQFLDNIVRKNMEGVYKKIQTLQTENDEDEIEEKAKRVWPGASSQTLKAITQIAKDKEQQERIRRFTNAQRNWQQLFHGVVPNKPQLAKVVTSVMAANTQHEAVESPAEVDDETTHVKLPVQSKSILKKGGASRWKMATEKVISKEENDDQSSRTATNTETPDLQSDTRTSNPSPSIQRDSEIRVIMDQHVSYRSSLDNNRSKDEKDSVVLEMSRIDPSDADENSGTRPRDYDVDNERDHLISSHSQHTEL